MTVRIADILAYDEQRRQIDGRANYGTACGCSTTGELASFIEQFCRVTLLDSPDVVRELAEFLRYRLLFVLLPESCLFGSVGVTKPVIREHLTNLGVEPQEGLVSALKVICDNFKSRRVVRRKFGIADVRVRFPHVYEATMAAQGNRCYYCGVPLVYGENAQLDHVFPYQLGDDPASGTNWCFSCGDCNAGKGEWPHYSLVGIAFSWVPATDAGELRPMTRFAALARDRRCRLCGRGPTEARLTVVRVSPKACWVLDNVRTVCVEHAVE